MKIYIIYIFSYLSKVYIHLLYTITRKSTHRKWKAKEEKKRSFFGNWKKYENKTEEGKERKKIMTYILVAYGRDSM